MPNETQNITSQNRGGSADALNAWLAEHMNWVLIVSGSLLGLLVLLFIVRAIRRRRGSRGVEAQDFSLNSVRSTDYRMRRAATKVLQREYLGWREENPPEEELDERAHPRVTIPEDKIEAVFSEHADILDKVFDHDALATILYRAGLGFRDEDDLVTTPSLIEIRDEKSGLVLVFDCVQPPTPPEQWEHAEELLALQFEAPGLVTRSPVFGERWVYLRNRYAHLVGDVEEVEADHRQVSEKREQSFKDRVQSFSAPQEAKQAVQVRKPDDFDDDFEVEFRAGKAEPLPVPAKEADEPVKPELPASTDVTEEEDIEASSEESADDADADEPAQAKGRWGRHGK